MTPTSIIEMLRLNIPETLKLAVTPEQFAVLAASNRELRLERTSQGELSVNSPTGWETGYRNVNISTELCLWWRNAGELGMVFDSSTGVYVAEWCDFVAGCVVGECRTLGKPHAGAAGYVCGGVSGFCGGVTIAIGFAEAVAIEAGGVSGEWGAVGVVDRSAGAIGGGVSIGW